jgi:hypothetical protein
MLQYVVLSDAYLRFLLDADKNQKRAVQILIKGSLSMSSFAAWYESARVCTTQCITMMTIYFPKVEHLSILHHNTMVQR